MSISVYLAGLILVILLASACLAAILVYFDPFSAGWLVFILFYLSLFIVATGLLTLIGLAIRWFSQKRILPNHQLEISFRQAILLSLILISALILQSQRILAWWHLLILVALVGSLEWRLTRK
jgi:hypothetical protein